MLEGTVCGAEGPAAAIRVFACDLDMRAVAAARTGSYPPSIITNVSAARLGELVTDGMHESRFYKGSVTVLCFRPATS